MSYNQKPPGSGGAGGGTGPPNGPNNTQQVAKTLAGIQQQMQNFVHAQNALPQSSQADFNTLLHQQRLQNMLKQQQQHLIHQHFQQQMQQQQQQHQQQQQQQQQNKVGTEPLALTRTPADLLNKTYQQHHQQYPNGNPNAPNPASLNSLQQLQVISPNLVQQIQAFQLQMQQHQQQQQQQHHSQTQQAQHHTPPPGPLPSLPQQQMHGQSAQQQKAAITTAAAVAAAQLQQRYLSVVTAQTAASQVTGGNKVGSTAPPPLTANQIKPPNLPPSTQITPVPANSGASQAAVKSTATGNTSASASIVASPTKQVSPSISLLPSKASTTTPTPTSIATHQQNKINANRNSTTATSVAAIPTPAHVQKTISSAVPLGSNTSPLSSASSSDCTAKPNLNTDTVATSAPMIPSKTPQKNTVTQPAKSTVSQNAVPSTAAAMTTKPQLSHGNPSAKQNTTNVHSQLPPPKSLQQVTKSAENRVESSTQNSAELTNQKITTKPTLVQETKAASVLNKTGEKSDTSVAVGKVDIPKSSPITVAESQVKNSVLKATQQSTSLISEKEPKEENSTQAKDQKNDHTPAKANNNNVAEKDKSAVKEESSPIVSHNKAVELNKKSAKEPSVEQVKLVEDKSPETTKNEASTNANTSFGSEKITSKPLKSELDKKPQNTTEIKKPSEELDNKVEKHKMSKNQSQENQEQKNNHSKEKDSFKEDDKKGEKDGKSDTKVETITETPEAIASPSTSNTKIKANKEPEPPASSESTPPKKPSRQPKSNKIIAPASSKASVQETEVSETSETIEKSDKNEKVDKGSSIRVSREEKRKTQKTSAANSVSSSPTTPKEPSSSGNDRKSQRHRLKTILYQSPLPELAFITKLSANEASNSPKPMSGEDKLIVFYKNEYMAVRNAEGTFYLCQTMQNVYRTSPRISIRWLSEDAKDSTVYIPDFYDHTDIECVLTTVELKRIDKGHLRLPETEKARIENILKKALDVEKGLVPRPELTEENPDGLDISLYKDESQIEKKLSGSQTPVSTARNSRRSTNANIVKSASKTNTPSKATGKKRKSTTSGASSAKKSKSPAKKRKPPAKRKSTRGTTSDEENETSEDHASDAEYKPSQKRSNVNMATKSSPRTQRSPLAKARVASPVASTSASARIKTPASKVSPSTPTPTPSRSERATKRKAGVEALADSPGLPAKKATSPNVNSAEPTSVVNPAKSSSAKVKETINNEETISKKLKTEASSALPEKISSLQTTQADSENTSANGSSSHSTATASRPTRSRK